MYTTTEKEEIFKMVVAFKRFSSYLLNNQQIEGEEEDEQFSLQT